MASFKAKFPVLQELFAKNHRGGPLAPPPSGARVNIKSRDKNRFFESFSKILTSHFSIAHDDFNDIDDDLNRKICNCVMKKGLLFATQMLPGAILANYFGSSPKNHTT